MHGKKRLEPELKSENKKNWFNSLHHERRRKKFVATEKWGDFFSRIPFVVCIE